MGSLGRRQHSRIPHTPLLAPQRLAECLSPDGDQPLEKLVCVDWEGRGWIILGWEMGSLRITFGYGTLQRFWSKLGMSQVSSPINEGV